MTATSSDASVPTTVAVYFGPVPATCTEMLVEPAITWLLVNTSPVGVRSIPVPAAWPPPTNVVVMSTTPRDASAAASPEPPGEGDAGAEGAAGEGLVGSAGLAGAGAGD